MRIKQIIRRFLPWSRIKLIAINAGRIIGFFVPQRNQSAIFFFFPFYQVGGAERIHADIVGCVAEQKPWVFFTNRSKDDKFKYLFEGHARLFEVSFLTTGSIAYYFWIGALTAFINRHHNALVFGCNNVLFYHLLPHLKRKVRRLDLLHAFGGGIEGVSLPFVDEIDTRVIYSSKVYAELKEQYAAAAREVDPKIIDRVLFINNQVAVPDEFPVKPEGARLKVLYVGRGAEEKRIHLVGRAATECRRAGIPTEFSFIGDVDDFIEPMDRDACILRGEIADTSVLNKFYDEADVLLMTSSREGVPMVIMEAMAHGAVPVSTNVGGIPDHVKHGVNGLLITANDEAEIVSALVGYIAQLCEDRLSLQKMSHNAFDYARENFTLSNFCSAYRRLLLGESVEKQLK